MAFNKQYGPVTVSESGGVFSAQISTLTLLQELLGDLATKEPSLATEIAAVQVFLAAEIAKA